MPTYEYRCSDCSHEFEESQSITSKPLIKCPACGRPGLQRLVGGGGGMIFRGKGFYHTDYKKSGQKHESETKTPANAKSKESKDGSSSPPPPAAQKNDTKSGSSS